MGIAHSTYYGAAPSPTDDTAIVEAIAAICEDWIAEGDRGFILLTDNGFGEA